VFLAFFQVTKRALMDCGEVWQDIFLTKPDYVEMDDEFVAPVMSVEVQRKAGTATRLARLRLRTLT
jgi:hypothetical protein